MSGVGGGGRRKLSCERCQQNGYRTPLALVGKGQPRAAGPCSLDGQGNRAVDHAAGAAPADSQTKREKQWPHFGKSTTRSANGNRSVHRRTTNRSSMACALPASFTNGGWKDPQYLEGQNSLALAYAHAALDIHGNGVCKHSA